VAADGSFTVDVTAFNGEQVVIHVQDPAGNASTTEAFAVTGTVFVPPDPATLAPPLDPTVGADLCTQVAFLYTGPDAIQTGVAPGTIDCGRIAVLSGRVVDRDLLPLAGVRVSMAGRPELGRTFTRADGRWDLVVNGGGQPVLDFVAAGRLPAQRRVEVGWQERQRLDDLALVELDAAVTTVTLGAGSPLQVARGSLSSDADGDRRATVLFPAGTSAELELAGGGTVPITALDFRATEYSVGPAGPLALPATLPPTVAYTYAVELSADQARAAGARSVRFDRTVPFYLESFLDLPVGETVPVGYYDRDRRRWIPSPNGRVVEILSIAGGVAELDLEGEGVAADAAALAELGITDHERQQLALLYPAGQRLWRVPLDHFTPITLGWPFGPVEELRNLAPELPAPAIEDDLKLDLPSFAFAGAALEIENQILSYTLPVNGTPFGLHYWSDRVPGRKAPYVLKVPIAEAEVPPAVQGIELNLRVAGTETVEVFPPTPDQEHDFEWDTLDEYGRPVPATEPVVARVGYAYDGYYRKAPPRDPSFGQLGGVVLEQRIREEQFVVSRESAALMGSVNARRTFGLGGWSLSPHHYFDRKAGVLHYGDGRRRTLSADAPAVLTRVAGTGVSGFNGDGLPAVNTQLAGANGLFVTADGGLLITDASNCRIRKIDPVTSLVETVAGRGCEDPTPGIGDGGPATAAILSRPRKAIEGPDGTLYIADSGNYRIRAVDPETGDIDTIAGIGDYGSSGHGGAAKNAALGFVTDIALGPDGSLYLTESNQGVTNTNGVPVLDQLRRIDPSGNIDIVAGGGVGFDPGPIDPNLVRLIDPQGVTVGFDNTIYLTHNQVLRRIGPDGQLVNVAGFTGFLNTAGFSGDGGPAEDAWLFFPDQLAVARDGSIYFADLFNDRVRRVSPNGIINTVAGGGFADPIDGLPATQAWLFRPRSVALDPAGTTLYVVDSLNIVWKMGVPGAFEGEETLVPSADGSLFYVFDSDGRHLRTENSYTGEVLLTFGYDEFDLPDEGDSGGSGAPPPAAQLLTRIEDAHGHVTTIEREPDGTPTAIVAPFGQRTELEIHPTLHYLRKVTRPKTVGNDEVVELTYDFDEEKEGLLRQLRDPKGNDYHHDYDQLGRVIKVEDPAGGQVELDFQETLLGHRITRTNASGRTAVYEVERNSLDEIVQSYTSSSGLETEFRRRPDGSLQVTRPDETEIEITRQPDPRFAALVMVSKTQTVRTPGEIERVSTTERAVNVADFDDPRTLLTQVDSVTVNGRTSSRSFDALTNELVALSPEGRRAVTVVDGLGRPVESRVEGIEPAHYQYDPEGRLEKILQGPVGASQREWSYTYDPDGRLETVTDAEEREVRYEYDEIGRITEVTLPDDRVIEIGYDLNGNVTAVTPPSRPTHTLDHNPVNQVVEYDPPQVGEPPAEGEPEPVDLTIYSYNDSHQPVLVTRPDGRTVLLAYDGSGRLDTVTLPRGAIDYDYDPANGQLTRVTAPDGGTFDLTYDGPLVETVSWSGAVSGSLEMGYDDSFRVISRTLGDDATSKVSFGYNDDNLLTEVGVGGVEGGVSGGDPLPGCAGGQELGCLEIGRDPQTGFVTGSELGEVIDDYVYNDFGELERYRVFFDSNSCTGGPCPEDLLFEIEVTRRDKLGRIEELEETRADPATGSSVTLVFTYTYDDAGRLTDVAQDGIGIIHYDYDGNGNRIAATDPFGSRTATYDDQDRLLTSGDASYAYTANGELLSKSANGFTVGYDYDVVGNLLAVTLDSGIEIEYLVDGANRRIGKKVDGTLVRGWLYKDGFHPVAELDGAGNLAALFVYGSKAQVPAAMVKGGAVYRLVSDYLGSVRLVVDVATGAVAQRLEYDAFGRILLDTNPGFQPFGYAGGLYDPQTGLVRFGARDYDPEVGRWTAKDPVRFGGGDLNLYGYTANDPVNFIDPRGRAVMVLDSLALERILSTLPRELRGAVVLEGGMISKDRINSVTSDEPSFVALQMLVNRDEILEVSTGKKNPTLPPGEQDFYFKSRQDVIAEVTPFLGEEQARKDVTGPESHLGVFLEPDETESGNPGVLLSDGTGPAESTTAVEHAVTTAHELYGHALLFLYGQPFEHNDEGVDDFLGNWEFVMSHTFQP
jgi:RHS repeat-associated protein